MARIGGFNLGKRREELLSSYEGEEPYMPGGYETPYDGEEPYMPEGYDDEGYDDAPYEDDYADYDGDYDDGYGDDYDDGYYDDGSRYDDDYGYDAAYDDGGWPEEGYDGPPYYDAPDYAPQRDYPSGGVGSLMRYVDEHEWVTWLLLLLLPPMGIFLLWRRGRFNQPSGVALGVLGVVWFAALMVLLILKPFKPAGDTTITPQPVGAAMLVTASPEAEQEAAQPVSSVITAEEVNEANAVYVVSDAPYYHQSEGCTSIPSNAEVTRVSRNTAIENSLMACPYCIAGQYSDGMWDLVFVNSETEDRSNMQVYCSAFNAHFHTDPTCSDLGTDAHLVGLKDALLMAKTACDTCCPDAGREVYCTVDGSYYHVEDECSGMRNANRVTYAEARVTGKKRCPVCIGGEDETETDAAQEAAAGYYVYATEKGNFYHVNATCSGMKDAKQVLLSEMIKKGRPPCPVCCPEAETTVYAENGNPYYHSYATCSGMTQATQGILVNALAAGLQRCPVCWTTGDAK